MKTNFTRVVLNAVALSTSLSITALKEGRPLSRRISYENTTSSAVSGEPSEKRASGRRLNITSLLSSGYSIDDAISP